MNIECRSRYGRGSGCGLCLRSKEEKDSRQCRVGLRIGRRYPVNGGTTAHTVRFRSAQWRGVGIGRFSGRFNREVDEYGRRMRDSTKGVRVKQLGGVV